MIMRLFDTHTHLYLPDFDGDGGGRPAVRRALDAGVEAMLMPNVDCTTVAPLRELCSAFPGRVFSAMGLHPTEIGSAWRDDLSRIIGCFRPEDVAVGEVGMDLYWDKTFRDEQMQALEVQAQYAVAHDLPLVIHCREALPETLEVLSGVDGVRGVMHSFGGTPADVDAVRRALGDDWYFGINGIVTFKNCRLHESLEAITLSRLLLETDSPYLAPVPHRGKRNESAYIGAVSGCVASVLGLESSEVAEKTFRNASDVVRIQLDY